jgi:hypothetical protein
VGWVCERREASILMPKTSGRVGLRLAFIMNHKQSQGRDDNNDKLDTGAERLCGAQDAFQRANTHRRIQRRRLRQLVIGVGADSVFGILNKGGHSTRGQPANQGPRKVRNILTQNELFWKIFKHFLNIHQ